jgi:hypothetical protein
MGQQHSHLKESAIVEAATGKAMQATLEPSDPI